jgi:multimeric flavodoxin WrbA
MVMKISIFNGSVRKDGRTAAVTSVLKQRLTMRKADVNEYFLYELGIKGCLTCGCGSGKDCATDLIDNLFDDDVVIFASSIRMQRTTDSLNGFLEMLFHMCRYDEDTMEKAKGMKAAVVLATDEGLDSVDESLQLFNEFFERVGMKFVGHITIPFDSMDAVISPSYKKSIESFADTLVNNE